jgi:hypothetical protein
MRFIASPCRAAGKNWPSLEAVTPPPQNFAIDKPDCAEITSASLQIAGTTAREHLVPIDVAQIDKMLASRFRSVSIVDQIIGVQTKLSRQEFYYRLRDRFPRCQQAPRKSKSAQLKCKAKLIAGAAARANNFQIIVRQNVMLKKRCFMRRKVKKNRTLALG